MRTILEQKFDELYAQADARASCIKSVTSNVDSYTKHMMFESLNQILMEVFGGSRFMYLIKVTDIAFVVTFVDRYKSMQTKSLILQFAKTFTIPDKQTILEMSESELKCFINECKQNGYSPEDVALELGMSKGWLYGLYSHRVRGGKPRIHVDKKAAVLEANRTKLLSQTQRYATGLSVLLRCLDDGVVPIYDLIAKLCPEDIKRYDVKSAYDNYKLHTSSRKFYDAVVAKTDKTKINKIYLSYCEECLRILDRYRVETVGKLDTSTGYLATIGRYLKIRKHYDYSKHDYVYSEAAINKVNEMRDRITKVLTKLKGENNA